MQVSTRPPGPNELDLFASLVVTGSEPTTGARP